MDTNSLRDAVLDLARDSDGKLKLDCTQAFALARKLGVEPRRIGQICNENDVRIRKCQLGCFP